MLPYHGRRRAGEGASSSAVLVGLPYCYTTTHHQPSKHFERCTVSVGIAMVEREVSLVPEPTGSLQGSRPKLVIDRHANLLDPPNITCQASQPQSAGPVAVDKKDGGSVVAAE